jgi:hypothetical protein
MAIGILGQVKSALARLNPEEVRAESERPVSIGLVAPTSEGLSRMERYFCPPELSAAKRAEVSRMLHRITGGERSRAYDIEVWDDSLATPDHVFPFDAAAPERTVDAVLRRRPELALSLGRHIQPFRKPVIDGAVGRVSRENALFSLATALPDVLPSLMSLPWALGEFASDTAFLTGNQIRMTFMIAAASDRGVGYREQRAQIGSIVAGAFGMRALARELVGKIPFGGGLLPKAAIAYAGTYVIGRSMERYYSIGYGFTQQERRTVFEQALERGREVARGLLEALRPAARATQ